MRPLTFYPKLALGNLWRNKSTYLPYLLACIVSIFTFYTLLAINMNGVLDGMRGESVVKSFTAIGTILLAIFCSILIFYTNSFLMKRRKKELGLYSILGMEKKNIAVLMFFETFFISLIALVLGLGLGLLLSKLLFWALLRMVRFTVMLEMPLSFLAIGITVLFFCAVFLLALFSNLRQVHLANPIDLMAGARQGEREPKASWLLTLVGIVCLGAGYFVALYFRSPLEVLMLFLLAVLLVIIGTYCLFTSGSIALLKLLRRNKRFYYQPDHFISVSGMIYRMKQNAAGLATICILSCMVLVTVSSTVSLNVGAEDSLEVQYPYAYDLRFEAPEDADVLLFGAQTIAAENGVSLTHLQDYHRRAFWAKMQGNSLVAAEEEGNLIGGGLVALLTLEEYNKNEGTTVSLAPGQALLFMTGSRYEGNTVTVNGIPYDVEVLETLGREEAGGRDIGKSVTLILPDSAAVDAVLHSGGLQIDPQRVLAFDLEGTPEAKAGFDEAYHSYVNGLHTQETFQFRVREDGREDWYATNGGFLFLGIYFGVLFMLAAAMIIYYKQMSEGYDDVSRFEILQKVGMGEEEVKHTINRQILVVFFLPLLVAVLHITVAFFPISRAMVIFGVLNTPLLVGATLLTIAAYTILYLLVFRQTAKTYYRIVRRQPS
ncbi:FtsX-like permease family protein [Ruminococcaceae bacterium OttesenSCG-928-I18]|nr:FtsX-like permease family protein [Ruminococcaceae bacterium OttesenSCG-928-I18]